MPLDPTSSLVPLGRGRGGLEFLSSGKVPAVQKGAFVCVITRSTA